MAAVTHSPSPDEIVSEIMRDMKRTARDILGESPLRPLEPLEEDNVPRANLFAYPSHANHTSPTDHPPVPSALPHAVTNGNGSAFIPSNSQVQEITSPSDVRAIVNSYRSPEHFLPGGLLPETLPSPRTSPQNNPSHTFAKKAPTDVAPKLRKYLPTPPSPHSRSQTPVQSPGNQYQPKKRSDTPAEQPKDSARERDHDPSRAKNSAQERNPIRDRELLREGESTRVHDFARERDSTRERAPIRERESTRGRESADERGRTGNQDAEYEQEGHEKLREKNRESKRATNLGKERKEDRGSDIEIDEDKKPRRHEVRERERKDRENNEREMRERRRESHNRARSHDTPSSADPGADTDSDSEKDITKKGRSSYLDDVSPSSKKRHRGNEHSPQPRRSSAAEPGTKRQKRNSNANLSRRNSLSGGDASGGSGSASNGGGGSVAASGATSGTRRLVIKLPSNVIMGQDRGSLSTKSRRKDRDDNERVNSERKTERHPLRDDGDPPRGSKRRAERDDDDHSEVKRGRKADTPDRAGRDGKVTKRARRERSDRDDDDRSEITSSARRKKEKDRDTEKVGEHERSKGSREARGKERLRQKDLDADRPKEIERSRERGNERDPRSFRGSRSDPIRPEHAERRMSRPSGAKDRDASPSIRNRRGEDRKSLSTPKSAARRDLSPERKEGSIGQRTPKRAERRGPRVERDGSPDTAQVRQSRNRNLDRNREENRNRDRNRDRNIDRSRDDTRERDRGGDRERSFKESNEGRDKKREEEPDKERGRVRGRERSRERDRGTERDQGRSRDRGNERGRDRVDGYERNRDRDREHEGDRGRNRERSERDGERRDWDMDGVRKGRVTQKEAGRHDADVEKGDGFGRQGGSHDREDGRKRERGRNSDLNTEVERRREHDQGREAPRERERERGSIGRSRDWEGERDCNRMPEWESVREKDREVVEGGRDHVHEGTADKQVRKDGPTIGKLPLRSIPPPVVTKSPKAVASPHDSMTGLRSVAVPVQDEKTVPKSAPAVEPSKEIATPLSAFPHSEKVNLKQIRAKQEEMEKAFTQAKQRCDELYGKKDYDKFEVCAKETVRLYFEYALAKESELRLSESEMRRMNAQEHSLRRKPLMLLYRDLAGSFVNKQVERLESIDRKEAVHFFRRATQKAYLRMALLQRTWAKDMKSSNENLRRSVVDAMNRCSDANGSASLDRGKLSQVKAMMDDFANMVQIAEQVVSDMGDGHEEAGRECNIC